MASSTPETRTWLSTAPITRRKRPFAACPPRVDAPVTRRHPLETERIMKTKILVLGLVLATLTTVIVYPTLRGNAANAGQGTTTTIKLPANGTKRVEVVFVLDTTGSMEGLIAAAKEKIWSIATTLSNANSAPEIRMGLVAYRDRGDAY